MSEAWPCCWHGCENDAAYSITFAGQPGHVHDCSPHTAVLREWTDIERVTDLPCRYSHDLVWAEAPRPL
jgi:hypothetical protein